MITRDHESQIYTKNKSSRFTKVTSTECRIYKIGSGTIFISSNEKYINVNAKENK